MKSLIAVTVSGGLFVASTLAIAQDTTGYPDMRGQWKGTVEGAVRGSGMYHREGEKPSEPRTMNKEFTLNIKGQDGRRFWGEIVYKDDMGPLVGVITSDKQTIHYVDNAGGACHREVYRAWAVRELLSQAGEGRHGCSLQAVHEAMMLGSSAPREADHVAT